MRPLLIERLIPVRTYDIDFAGHVSNIVYIRWLEDMRLSMLETHWPLENLLQDNLAPTAQQAGVFVNVETKRPVGIPQGLYELYRKAKKEQVK